ncbi:MAG: InlB B-repeat-containing protein, partial [Treponema sp.]|nr:InlB B-repeat-containing protein [Treponema sp.]
MKKQKEFNQGIKASALAAAKASALAAALFAGLLALSAFGGCKSHVDDSVLPAVYTLTFDSAGGSILENIADNDRAAIAYPPEPVRAGFVFSGWFSGPEGSGEKYKWPHTLTGDLTMYAYWKSEVGPFTITFDIGGGGQIVAPVTEPRDKFIDEEPAPFREGFEFRGWFNAPEGGSRYPFPHKIEKDLTMYVHWAVPGELPGTSVIIFETDGGSRVAPVTAYIGDSILEPGKPVKASHTFLGWFYEAADDNDNKVKHAFPYLLQSGSVTMYAHWELSRFILTFDSRGGSEIAPITADKGTKIPKPRDPVKSGYKFAGWYNERDEGEGELYKWDTDYELNSNTVIMYAHWNPDREADKPYKVIFNAHGGITEDELTHYTGNPLTYFPDFPKDDDYSEAVNEANEGFKGWFEAEKGGTKLGSTYPLTGDITLHAQFVRTYTIIFYGTDALPIKKTEGESVTLPAYPNNIFGEYEFLGWWDKVAGGGIQYGPDIEVTKNLVLYAHLRPQNQIQITFDTRGGSAVNSVSAYPGDRVAQPAAPTRTGYIFDGWYDDYDDSDPDIDVSKRINFAKFQASAGDITLYAKWRPVTYTVIYYTNRHTTDNNFRYVDVEYDATITLDDGKNLDWVIAGTHKFVGWNTEKNGVGGVYYWANQGQKNLRDTEGAIILYAQYSVNEPDMWTVTFHFNDQGVTPDSAVRVIKSAEISAPSEPKRPGYTFIGWFASPDSSTKFTWPYTPTANVEMYARWERKTYNITYFSTDGLGTFVKLDEAGNGGNPLSFTHDNPTFGLKNAAKTGYGFEGWYSNINFVGNNVTSIRPTDYDNDLTLYARWSNAKISAITFNANGGSNGSPNVHATFGLPMPSGLNAPSRVGYDFAGFFDTSKNVQYYDAAMRSVRVWDSEAVTATLTAYWDVRTNTITYDTRTANAVEIDGYSVEDLPYLLLEKPKAERKGYTFAGWYDNIALSGSPVVRLDKNSSGDKVFYANWAPIRYTITYSMNGGANASGNPASYTVESPTTRLLAPPARTGYQFLGWYEDGLYQKTTTTACTIGEIGNKTIYARWENISYTVTYNANGGSGSTASSLFTTTASTVTLAASSFNRAGYVFAGWNTRSDGAGTLYPSGRPVTGLSTVVGATVPLYAYWLPLARTIELDKPWRTEGAVDGKYRWAYNVDRQEYVIYANNWPSGEEEIYVTGSTTEARIRVVPETMVLSDWNQSVRGINTNTIQNYVIKSNAYACDTWKVMEGYPGNRKIPEYMFKLHSNNAHWQTIVFVNAEIRLSDGRTRSPVDVGPYHDGDGTGFIHGGRDYGHSDYEVHATLQFRGAYNVLENTRGKAVAVWDSKAEANVYNAEVPTPPDSDSVDSWRTSHNLPYWEAYRITCLRLVDKWGL